MTRYDTVEVGGAEMRICLAAPQAAADAWDKTLAFLAAALA